MIVERLRPGSDAHRTAVNLMLLFQDSLHALTEAADHLAELKRQNHNR